MNTESQYTIDDLVETWKRGWRHFAEYMTSVGVRNVGGLFGDAASDPTTRMFEGFALLFNYMLGKESWVIDTIRLREWAKGSSESVSRGLWSSGFSASTIRDDLKPSRALKATLMQLTHAVLAGTTVRDALCERLQHVVPPKVGDSRLVLTLSVSGKQSGKCVSVVFHSGLNTNFSDMLALDIPRQLASMMGWLSRGVESRIAADEAFCNCLWLALQPELQALQKIRECIVQDVPPTEQQVATLRKYLDFGIASPEWIFKDDGSQSLRLCVQPRSRGDRDVRGAPRYPRAAITGLLCIPAWTVARELERKLERPRFIRTCRAPSCGKKFWTGRANATNCPGTQGGKKNECALEWIRYRRYLAKVDRDPEKDWNKPQHQERFRAYDNS